MKKIKGKKKLSRKLAKIFYTFTGYDLKFIFGSDFLCEYDKDKIYYTLLLTEPQDKNFSKFVSESFHLELTHEVDVFIFSILHEIGHFATIDNIPQKDIDFSIDQKAQLSQKKDYTEQDYKTYFNLPIEYAASQYAANMIKYDKQGLTRLYKEVSKALNKFYKKNV